MKLSKAVCDRCWVTDAISPFRGDLFKSNPPKEYWYVNRFAARDEYHRWTIRHGWFSRPSLFRGRWERYYYCKTCPYELEHLMSET